jgi:hypothetical protein
MSSQWNDFFRCRKEGLLLGIGSAAWVYVESVFVSYIVNVVEVKRTRWSIRVAIAQVDAGFLETFACRLGEF